LKAGNLSPSTVLVIGADDATRPLAAALRMAGFAAWRDRLGRVAGDLVSFEWADAVVIADPTEHVESQHLRLVTGFDGPKILVTAAAIASRDQSRLLDRGFDAVLAQPCHEELLIARLRSLLRPRHALTGWTPGHRPLTGRSSFEALRL
jgi:DNA-binding response OmpR family regulator